ncbi:hypothetical protein PILCRDRAFT_314087 [Piloderma croceum F 1598]|uniref:Uncharacterized protein n=1 Tax=Piloderma croceum (strain F 1598) TaxID=765440 RepID=A0A0C3CAK9_PILCF|nr:hypothetical protein PILCRDRAFT_314087 [Piloderma croceum F 1598]
MTTCMNDIEQLYDARYQKSKDTILVTMTEQAKVLIPLLQFVSRSASQNDSACRTALNAGILDLLLRIYVIFPSFSRSAIDAPEHWSPLLKACRSTLHVLSRSETNHDVVLQHPVCFIWMDCHPHPPVYSLEPRSPLDVLLARCAAWRETGKACVRRRIMMIFIDSLWKSNAFEIENAEACTDIVEFARPRFYGSDIVELAFLTMLKLVVLNGDAAEHFMCALGPCSRQIIVHIFSGIFGMWIECIQVQQQIQHNAGYQSAGYLQIGHKSRGDRAPPGIPIDADESFYNREKSRLFEKVANVDMALYNVIIFATNASRWSESVRRAMLDAGALSLVIVAFVNADFLPSNLVVAGMKGKEKETGSGCTRNAVDGYYHPSGPIPLSVIQAEAATLSVLMHDATFRGTWHKSQLNIRRRLCSSLVDALLGDFGDRNDKYAWTRSLFRKILNG